MRLPDGSEGFVKHGDTAAEVAGLRWLAVPGGPPPPEVLGEDPLVTRMVPAGRPTRAAAEEFGRRLAVLHAAGADAFGSPPPGGPADALIGRAPMRNDPAPSWPQWYARDRVLPYVRAARDARKICRVGLFGVERLHHRAVGEGFFHDQHRLGAAVQFQRGGGIAGFQLGQRDTGFPEGGICHGGDMPC